MKFTNSQELSDILLSFESKAKELTTDPKRPITLEYRVEGLDGKEYSGDGEGVIYKAFFKYPPLMQAGRAFDLAFLGKYAEAGIGLFDSTFLSKESDSIFEDDDSYKLGVCARLGLKLDVKYPEYKKK